MPRILQYPIFPSHDGMQVLPFLREKGFSRHILASMKPCKEAIRLNDLPAGGRSVLHAGDVLTITLPPEEANEKILPTKLPLSVLYEDEDLLVVNKAADMPIHPSIGNYENTLANAAAWYFKDAEEPFVYRCINRLDRDTTGALILAKNSLSAAILSDDIRHRRIRRTYLALAQGKTPEEGTISAPIARETDSAISRCVDFERGEHSVTHYERLDYRDGLSLVELHLETGRTHQIRVHMKYIGHPLPGDFLYYPVYDRIGRQALHSYQLDFLHPITKEPLCFTAPVPEDFCRAFLHHFK
jgi:23S rRNA pseudouridine1911/1915/1917 synthase